VKNLISIIILVFIKNAFFAKNKIDKIIKAYKLLNQ
jgi:hypothetical protein